jgi:LPXTG-motif cell wall-anchored protein
MPEDTKTLAATGFDAALLLALALALIAAGAVVVVRARKN